MEKIVQKLDACQINYLRNVSALNYSTMKTPGILDLVIPIVSVSQLKSVIDCLGSTEYAVLGLGSNTLFAVSLIETPILLFRKEFSRIDINRNRALIEAGASNAKLILALSNLDLGGLEFLSGIPGSVGGSVVMNASCYGRSIGELVEKVLVLDKGIIRWVYHDECQFGYRTSVFMTQKMIVLKVIIVAEKVPSVVIRERLTSIIKKKQETQVLNQPSLGSIFKNPFGHKAYELIRKIDLSDCEFKNNISSKHANFIVNPNNIGGKQIYALIETIKKRVYQQEGIMLEEEITIIRN